MMEHDDRHDIETDLMSERDVRRFDRWSGTYESSWMQRLLFDRVHRSALGFAPSPGEPAVILDLGCGTGRLLRRARDRWPDARLIGIDPAPGMVGMAQRLTPFASFYVATADALPLPDASVDLALTTMSFHHWRDQSGGVRQVARALRPGGHFILADQSPPAWIVRLLRNPRIHGEAGFRSIFEEAGLLIVRQKRIISGFILIIDGTMPSDNGL